jgi:23S rRNA (guanosine2251-2'-O)-methyltransferase
MGNQRGTKTRKSSSAAKHQIHWLWGQQSVLDTLAAGRWRVYELFATAELMEQHADLLKAKQREGIELEIVSPTRLEELSQSREHQGIVARVSKYPYQTMESLENQIKSFSESSGAPIRQPLLVIIDRVQDTFNFAAILRACESAGVSGVIVGEHCQAQVTTQVARASAGAVNHFPIFQCADLVIASQQVKELGLRLVTADSKSHQSVCDASLNAPIAILVGSDAHGLDPLLLGICDLSVSIPTFGKVPLQNSVISTGILLYEIRRQQR